MKRRYFVLALLLSALTLTACHGWDTDQAQADKLATLLDWKPGSVVAEIGAGDGRMSLAAAERVGPAGRVYSTELDPKKLARLEGVAAGWRLHNLSIIKAGAAETNLPRACCDSVFMRAVYHHFTQPAEIDASIFQALRPGGRLAVIDFPPQKLLSVFFPLKGVPSNRGGHGIPQKVLIDELTAAGFQVVSVPKGWPGAGYCVVLRRPEP